MVKIAAVKPAETKPGTENTGLPPNAFIGKPAPPQENELASALRTTKPLWDRLLRDLCASTTDGQEWHCYSKKAGWVLKLKRGDRTILYLSPLNGCFRASFALGEAALKSARASRLPASVLTLLADAKKYAEGTAVRIEVRAAADAEVVKKLAQAKLEN